MATIKQETALEKTVENGGNITQAMREAGYSEATVNNPSNLTKSKGFQELCQDSGLTDSFLIDSLVDDIREKKGHRKAELELAFKIKGRLTQKISMDNKPISIQFDSSFSKNEIKFVDFSG